MSDFVQYTVGSIDLSEVAEMISHTTLVPFILDISQIQKLYIM